MSRVNVDASAFHDPRFVRLARYLGLADADHARGKVERVWLACTFQETYSLPVEDVAIAMGLDDEKQVADALIKARLAEPEGDLLRIKGTTGRTDWLAKKREAGRKGAERRWSEGDQRQADSTPIAEPMGVPSGVPMGPGMHSGSGSGSCSGTTPAQDPPKPPKGGSRSSPGRRKGLAQYTAEEREVAERVLTKLSERAGVEYRPTTEQHVGWVVARLRQGYTELQLRTVVWHQANEWEDKPEMRKYLRPSTLFRPQKFAEYLPAAEAAWGEVDRQERSRDGPPPRDQPHEAVNLLADKMRFQ